MDKFLPFCLSYYFTISIFSALAFICLLYWTTKLDFEIRFFLPFKILVTRTQTGPNHFHFYVAFWMYLVNDAHDTTQYIRKKIETLKCSKPMNLTLIHHEMYFKKMKIQLKFYWKFSDPSGYSDSEKNAIEIETSLPLKFCFAPVKAGNTQYKTLW